MTPSRTRLENLQEIADLLAERALRPLAAETARVAAIRARIARLEGLRTRLSEDGGDGAADPAVSAYLQARAEAVRRAQAAEYRVLAGAEAEIAGTRATARKALGRAEALRALRREMAGRR
jgi:hypothetical protein